MLMPDKTTHVNGLPIHEYFLFNHNVNRISLPGRRTGCVMGITIHNTPWITTSPQTTPAEQYTRATVNGNMNGVVTNYYVDDKCGWHNMPDDYKNWTCADGEGNGNGRTISIECIMASSEDPTSLKSEDNCAKLTAYLLKKYSLSIGDIYTHNDWYKPKYCPIYILPHWDKFLNRVRTYYINNVTAIKENEKELYRVRKEWEDKQSQLGAFSVLDNAIMSCQTGYSVFDKDGNVVYSKKPASKESKWDYEYDEDILSLQTVLNSKGASLVCDGKSGEKTYEEVTRYTIEFSDRGALTQWVQKRLNKLGYDCGEADGIAGIRTMSAIADFQKKHNLGVGYLGGTDWYYLIR